MLKNRIKKLEQKTGIEDKPIIFLIRVVGSDGEDTGIYQQEGQCEHKTLTKEEFYEAVGE